MDIRPLIENDPRVKALADQLREELTFDAAIDILAIHMVTMEMERDIFDKAMEHAGTIVEKLMSSHQAHLETIELGKITAGAAAKFRDAFASASLQLKKRRDDAITGSRVKLAQDPKQADKSLVRECWDAWQKKPENYKNKSKFADDMRDKFPNLESKPVIERWCRTWERETKPSLS